MTHDEYMKSIGLVKKKDDEYWSCPKCGNYSGDSWSQCNKSCPVTISPHYEKKNTK